MCRVTFLRMRCMIFMVDCAGVFFSKVTSAFFHRCGLLLPRQRCQVLPKPYSHVTAWCYTRRRPLPAIKYTVARTCLHSKHRNIFLVKTFPFLVLNLLLKLITHNPHGFGGLGVACWPLVPKFAGTNPAEAVGILGRKNPQHAFLRRGSKAVDPMS